jgi:hypothetical protein
VLRIFVWLWGFHVRRMRIRLALLTSIEEYYSREVKDACSRGRRKLLNIKCSMNYEITGAFSRSGKGKAHIF